MLMYKRQTVSLVHIGETFNLLRELRIRVLKELTQLASGQLNIV